MRTVSSPGYIDLRRRDQGSQPVCPPDFRHHVHCCSWLDGAAQRRDSRQSEEGALAGAKPVYVPLWRFDGALRAKIQATVGHSKLELIVDQRSNQLVNKVNIVWNTRSTERLVRYRFRRPCAVVPTKARVQIQIVCANW